MSSSELQADDSEEGGVAEDKGGTPVDIITYMSSRLTGREDECVADEEPDTVCPRTWVPRRCGRCGARRCGKGEGEECLFCGIDTTNGEKGQGKGKGKGPVPQQPQGGQRLPARERSRSARRASSTPTSSTEPQVRVPGPGPKSSAPK